VDLNLVTVEPALLVLPGQFTVPKMFDVASDELAALNTVLDFSDILYILFLR
jgi:hypothetical protein